MKFFALVSVASLGALSQASSVHPRQQLPQVSASACFNNVTSGEEECWGLQPTKGLCAFLPDFIDDVITKFESLTPGSPCTLYSNADCTGKNQTIPVGEEYVDVKPALEDEVSSFLCGVFNSTTV